VQGILFKEQLTLANLELKKTRTSRTRCLDKINEHPDDWNLLETVPFGFYNSKTGDTFYAKCPYGKVCDTLYGKEKYKVVDVDLKDLDKDIQRTKVEYFDGETKWVFRPKDKVIVIPDKFHSPMMMPEWASRYHIILEGIGVQRIQSITPEDCMREGIDTEGEAYCLAENHSNAGVNVSPPYYTFSVLWDSINHNWGSNLWSWFLYYRVKIK
jgi:hypothetical protein